MYFYRFFQQLHSALVICLLSLICELELHSVLVLFTLSLKQYARNQEPIPEFALQSHFCGLIYGKFIKRQRRRSDMFEKVLSIQVFWLCRDQFHLHIYCNIWGKIAPRTEPRYTHPHTSVYCIYINLMQIVEGSHSMTPGEQLKHPGGKVALYQLPVHTPGLFIILWR